MTLNSELNPAKDGRVVKQQDTQLTLVGVGAALLDSHPVWGGILLGVGVALRLWQIVHNFLSRR